MQLLVDNYGTVGLSFAETEGNTATGAENYWNFVPLRCSSPLRVLRLPRGSIGCRVNLPVPPLSGFLVTTIAMLSGSTQDTTREVYCFPSLEWMTISY
jgi:hypothetical protein